MRNAPCISVFGIINAYVIGILELGIISSVVVKRKIAKFKEAIKENPSPTTIGELARFYIQSGDNESAFHLIEASIKDFPDSELINELWNYLSKHKVSGVLRDMLQALDENPRPDHFEAVIGIYHEQNNISAATEYSRRYIHAFPEHAGAYRTMGEMRMERFAEDFAASDGRAAECVLKQAVELDPDDIQASVLLARLYYWCGLISRSRRLLNRVVEREPWHQEAVDLLSACKQQEDQDEDPDLRFSAIEEQRGFINAWPEDMESVSYSFSEKSRSELKDCLDASVEVDGVVHAAFIDANGERIDAGEDNTRFREFVDNLSETARKASLRMDIGSFEKGVVEGVEGGVLVRELTGGGTVAFQLEGRQNTNKTSHTLGTIVEEMIAICGKSNEKASEETE